MQAESSDKPASRDWSVNVGGGAAAGGTPPAAKVPVQPASKGRPVSVSHKPAAPAAASQPQAGSKPSAEEQLANNRAARLDKILAAPPSRGGKLAPIALGVVLALLIGAGISAHLSKKKAAEQQAAQCLATVTGFIARLEEVKKQAGPYQQQLDATISELQALIAAPALDQESPKRVDRAISTVSKVENAVFSVEADEEQARQALEGLAARPNYQALSEKLRAALADYKGQQKAVDGKCQKARTMIQSAQRRTGADK